jgi:RimJ/RimL family protein N-acetyltransferase
VTGACTIRKLGRDDVHAWASLRREALEAHPLSFGASPPDDPRILVEFALARIAASDESAVLGAFIGGSMVGMVGILRKTREKERHKALLWGMYVTQARRRNGAGAMLLRAAIQHGKSWAGVDQIHLAVTEVSQDARRVYERHGFREWGREPRALCWEGRCTDSVHMVLELREAQQTA